MDETLKKANKNKKSIPICPRCGSTNLKNGVLLGPQKVALYTSKEGVPMVTANQIYLLNKYLCLDCDYFGTCPEIDADKVDDFKKDIEAEKNQNNN